MQRQRTLKGALDWSYDLLSGAEQLLFGRLSVFAGGWTLEAAEAVGLGDGIEQKDVFELHSGLVDKSVVVAEATQDGGVRYRLLEPGSWTPYYEYTNTPVCMVIFHSPPTLE